LPVGDKSTLVEIVSEYRPFPLPTKLPSDEPQDTEDGPKIYEGQSYF